MTFWSTALPAAAGIVVGAAGMAAWGAVSPTAQLLGPTLCRTPRSSQIALTFDDGPNPTVTPRLLALLEEHNVPATFFLIGRSARACPEITREIAARGHVIGNHTESHPNLAFASTTDVEDEISLGQESIAGALASMSAATEPPQWFRPPFGYRLPHVWRAAWRAGLRDMVTWSFTAYDWKPQPAERLIARLGRVARRAERGGDASSVAGGEIVLLHDGDYRRLGADRDHVVTALEHWLPRWQDAGIEFVTIDEAASVPVLAA